MCSSAAIIPIESEPRRITTPSCYDAVQRLTSVGAIYLLLVFAWNPVSAGG